MLTWDFITYETSGSGKGYNIRYVTRLIIDATYENLVADPLSKMPQAAAVKTLLEFNASHPTGRGCSVHNQHPRTQFIFPRLEDCKYALNVMFM